MKKQKEKKKEKEEEDRGKISNGRKWTSLHSPKG